MRRAENKIIILTIIAVVIVWFADAVFDSFLFHEGTFLDLLIKVKSHEFYLRLVLTVSLLAFGVIIANIVSRQKRVEEVIRRHSAAIESSMDGVAISDKHGAYLYVNSAYATINGYSSPDEIIGKTDTLTYDDKERERMIATLEPALQKSGQWRGELIARRKNGSTYFQEASITSLDDGGRVCIIRDITWRKRSEERLHRSGRFLNTIFDSIRDPFCIFDKDFRIIRVNEAYAQMKNMTVQQLLGEKCYGALEGKDSMCEGCVVGKTFHSADPCAKDKHVVLPNGSEVWMEIYTYPIHDEKGGVSHVIEYTRDITDRKRSEDEKRKLIDKLEYLSNVDGLTDLLNRRALTECLRYEMDRARRYESELSIVICDIDNFKELNDTYGHAAGDTALRIVSDHLRTLLRKSDIAGRYGGDEFMMILPETSLTGAEAFAEKIRAAIEHAELHIGSDGPVTVSLSFGVTGLGRAAENIDELVKRVDGALYASKQAGRNKVTTLPS